MISAQLSSQRGEDGDRSAICNHSLSNLSGLKESKEYIDALTTELKETYPESFQSQKQGCAAVIVIGALIVAGAGYLLYPLIT